LGTYNGTTFEIGPNSVSHNRNFLWSKKKEVLLTNIKEIELKSGFLQKFFGLGTVVMHTQASTAGNNKTGLSLFDLENANKVYESLKENISKATAGSKT
jgi:membrane protein YdbS with pleckstrin-like domain